MREFIKKIYLGTQWGKKLITPLLFLRSTLMPEKTLLKSRFKRILGYPLNLKNPKTFNEKINWLKINERTSLHTICSDKYAVREHVQKLIGSEYLIPLLLETKKPSDIVPDNLPDFPFIIKTNNDSGGGIIVWDKKKMDWAKIRRDLKNRLNTNYSIFGKGEWQYENIKPRIIVEKLMIDENNQIPSDYKLHYFNGKLIFTQVDIDRHNAHKRNLYDPNWKLLPCKWAHENGKTIEKPRKYEELKFISEKLAQNFTYVRIDVYVIKNNIYFGEITFHSGSGNERFMPQEWDRKLGDMLTLPFEQKNKQHTDIFVIS
ncbi:ATP-grasp fold amidoligase family protein [Arenibacter sp. GZD96]|uniref:ATP-grasp fold amidoligase family protein n=1 Tax=Aurantibrevibacter litoralis TaxID=3106030 RepID=UPI002B003A8E|nr:ATP-grasp fold amidoligase family protein [Arenibacter sp. GZD-96]MEA1787685.1 ATP-grasp fold amidoligase family protein [Arenibacter sp. GZD-96]